MRRKYQPNEKFLEKVNLHEALSRLTYAGMSEEETESNVEGGNDEQNEDGRIQYNKKAFITLMFAERKDARYSGKSQTFFIHQL